MTHSMRTTGRRLSALLIAVALIPGATAAAVQAQTPRTRAEATDWLETSRYADVVEFIDAVSSSPVLHATTFGYTVEGRALPLVVVGANLADGSPESVRATGRTRVYVQANIHAGEVEGKEAMQVLLRRFAGGEHASWLDSLVVLIAPIYNADGNERVSVTNRWRQAGPLGGVGERANAQGLDLNRDHMKLESPEARSLAALMTAYDPHVVVDLHTTNGTLHGYHLTYSPPLHPGTAPEIVALLRERWLPTVTERVAGEHGWRTYYYGNAYAPQGGERGWYTFDYRPRFNNNYAGLRNRFGILSEAYSYVPFRDRVASTLAFVEEVLRFAWANAGEIAEAVATAEGRDLRGTVQPLRARPEAGERVDILMGDVEERLSPYSGRRYRVRTDAVRREPMRDYGTFEPVETGVVPAAYFIPAGLTAVLDLLEFHGVEYTELPSDQAWMVERFRVDSTAVAGREFQGHRERTLFGAWEPARVALEAGTAVVDMAQPLARLVFHLLEPRSPDGVANWNLVDEALEDAEEYPIYRQAAGADSRNGMGR